MSLNIETILSRIDWASRRVYPHCWLYILVTPYLYHLLSAFISKQGCAILE